MKKCFFFVMALISATIAFNPVFSQTTNNISGSESSQKSAFSISDARDLSVSGGYFFDAGGNTGTAGDQYAITTLSATTDCIELTFEELDLPAGAELRVFLGKDINAPAFGIFEHGDKIWNINAPQITFEYVPAPMFTTPGSGWKARIAEIPCDTKSAKATWPESDCPYAIPLCSNSTVVTGLEQYTDLGVVNDDNGSCYSGTGSGGSVGIHLLLRPMVRWISGLPLRDQPTMTLSCGISPMAVQAANGSR
jgi:hypothetical protein